MICVSIVSDVEPILFSFRVKFYPADPFRLSGNGKIMLYQQLKRDYRLRRLYCLTGEAEALGSLIIQGKCRQRMGIGSIDCLIVLRFSICRLSFAIRFGLLRDGYFEFEHGTENGSLLAIFRDKIPHLRDPGVTIHW